MMKLYQIMIKFVNYNFIFYNALLELILQHIFYFKNRTEIINLSSFYIFLKSLLTEMDNYIKI